MGCNTCDIKKKNSTTDNTDRFYESMNNSRPALFNGKFGKTLYFFIALVICLTPIINFVGVYFFYKAIFGEKKNKSVIQDTNNETNVEINQDTNLT